MNCSDSPFLTVSATLMWNKPLKGPDLTGLGVGVDVSTSDSESWQFSPPSYKSIRRGKGYWV
jgi:hypothetical protein